MKKSSYTYDDLISCANGDLFGPGNAKLPAPPMLMFDRITEISENKGEFGKGFIVAELDIKDSLWFFDCHFKKRSCNARVPWIRCYVAACRILFGMARKSWKRKSSRS